MYVRIINYELSITNYQLRIINYQLRIRRGGKGCADWVRFWFEAFDVSVEMMFGSTGSCGGSPLSGVGGVRWGYSDVFEV